ncbi:hypothetical protein REPUB_Repub04eG0137300 [Reevesia pubescens]
MFLVTSSTIHVLWNKECLPVFKPTRGIRQEDPISSYLFVLCLEKLSHLINKEVKNGHWKPFMVTRQGPGLSHICFADDMMLFGKATSAQVDIMMKVLNHFCEALGEKVSTSKSRMLVSSNMTHDQAMSLSNKCNIPLTKDFGKYLGAPMIHGRVTRKTYWDIISKM